MAENIAGTKNPLTYLMTEVIDEILRQSMFCLPGKITAFDPGSQLAQVQCGIQRMVDGRGRTIPVIENVPVHFAGDNQWYHWHQITPGQTEGLIHFSQRAIDTWLDQGGPVAPHEIRLLSVEDAFFVPGVRSKPNAISNLETSGAGISNYAGNVKISLTDSGIELTVGGQTLSLTSGGLTHNGINIGATHTHAILSGSSQPGPTGTPQ